MDAVRPSNHLLDAFPPDFLARLQPAMRRASLPLGMPLLEPGEPITHVYFPLTALISLLVVTADGASVEVGIVGRDGGVGLQRGLGERRSFTRANVQIAGDICIVPGAALAAALKDHPAASAIAQNYVENKWAESQQGMACNAVHDAPARLSRWLLQAADRTHSDWLPLTQEFLSQMLGVRRTTVTMIAQALQDEGLIKYSRGRISIVNRPALEKRSCECYEAMRRIELPMRGDEAGTREVRSL